MQMLRHTQDSKVIAIMGPTASGKSALGIALAKKFNGEIISADSRQLYRHIGIISGAPGKREMQGVRHHMVGIADPKKQLSAGEYKKRVEKILPYMVANRIIPIVVGGTGFYADVLLGNMVLPEVPPNPKLRAKLQKKTAPQLFAQLQKLDPRRAKTIDPHNKVRLIRALEIVKVLGKVPDYSSILQNTRMDVLWIGIALEQKRLEKNIRARIKVRLKKGLLKEAQKLHSRLTKKRFCALGAEFVFLGKYLDKEISKQELVEKLARWEIKYAKRQMRWNRRNNSIHWIRTQTQALRLARTFLRN